MEEIPTKTEAAGAKGEDPAKKKKKKNKHKKKKPVEEKVEDVPVPPEVVPRETPAVTNEKQDLLYKLLCQEDDGFEKLLSVNPDFSRFDEIHKGLQEKFGKMDETINAIFTDRFEGIPDEEVVNNYKISPDDKNLDPKKKSTIADLKQKADMFKEKLQRLDFLQESYKDEIQEQENEMIKSIRGNLLDDIRRTEDLMNVIANLDA